LSEARILAVDTALGACSAALLEDDRVLARRHVVMERGHAEALAPMVDEVMREVSCPFSRLDRLAVTTGPGTFTGQRVGLSFMRGLRVALGKPLLGVTSLAAMAEEARHEANAECAAAVHDARRGEVYLQAVGQAISVRLVAFETAVSLLEQIPNLIVAGTAAARIAEVLKTRGRAVRLSAVTAPDAVWVARLAQRLEANETVPRPLYLRAPDAKLPASR
jgi:tRNA threonylcarbamoyladenosine biosynthesis protein TsaB